MSEQFPVSSYDLDVDYVPAGELPVLEQGETYREQLMDELLDASTGTVGIHMSLDLTYQERSDMKERQEARLGHAVDNSRQFSAGGYGNYGERIFDAYGDKPMLLGLHHEIEGFSESDIARTLLFDQTEDGQMEVTYGFEQLRDDSGRTGGIAAVGFVLTPTEATKFLMAASADPEFVTEFVAKQMASQGISDERISHTLAPHIPAKTGEQLTVIERDTKGNVLEKNQQDFNGHKFELNREEFEATEPFWVLEDTSTQTESSAGITDYAELDAVRREVDAAYPEAEQLTYEYSSGKPEHQPQPAYTPTPKKKRFGIF